MNRLPTLTLLIALIPALVSAGEPRDQYGGLLSVQLEATGFFRVDEIGDRWCFITPDGHPYIALGANHVGKYLKEEAEPAGLLARHGNDPEQAADALLDSLHNLGFTAGDAYQPDPRFAERVPWVKSFHYAPEGGKLPPNVFDEGAVKAMFTHVKAECAKIADNPWVLGVAGPDLPRWDSSYAKPYRLAAPGSSGRIGYETFLQSRHESIASLNKAYGTDFDSWEALAAQEQLRLKVETHEAKAGEEAFLAFVADRHFATLRTACKAGAPNHLFFGERTQLRVIPHPVLKAMGKHIDVFCTQSLIRLPKSPPEWQVFQQKYYDLEQSLVDKPVVIIDWAAPFTLSETPDETEYGTLRPEKTAGRDAAQFVHDGFDAPYLIGLFVCQAIGTHGNDNFFSNAKRTYLMDDGREWPARTELLRRANHDIIDKLYSEFESAVTTK